MSIVCARVLSDGAIEMAADSGVFSGDQICRAKNFFKMYPTKLNGVPMLVGSVGRADEIRLFMRYIDEQNTSPVPKIIVRPDIHNLMVGFYEYIHNIRETDVAFQRCVDEEPCNGFLIAIPGHLYQCCGLDIDEIGDYTAIGSGEEYALGAMYMKASAQQAVEASFEFCVFVRPPVVAYIMYPDGRGVQKVDT